MNWKTLLAACCFVLFASPSFAATFHMYVSEYTTISPISSSRDNAQIAQEVSVDQPVVDYSGGAASSNAFAANTVIVRIVCTSTCSILFGTTPTATTANKILAAGVPEYFGVQPGQKVSAVTNTDF